jgi:phage regulator Rha-like protein
MTQELTIIQVKGEHRIDSRLLARELGYDHKVVLQSIRRHRARLEAKSSLLHFEAVKKRTTRGATRETYYLLDERQCLILAGSLKKGEEADEWHDRLVDAFLQARERVRLLEAERQQPSPPLHTLTDALRPRALENLGNVPEGYFSVMGELFKHLYNLEAVVDHALDEQALIEISVGQLWSTYARDTLGIPDQARRAYPHRTPQGHIVQAWAYPIQYVNIFANWLWNDYFPNHFPAYQRYRQRRVACSLLVPSRRQAPRPPSTFVAL